MSIKHSVATVIRIQPAPSCEGCSVRKLCLPVGLDPNELAQLLDLVGTRPVLRAGEYVYRVSDPFHSLYAVKSGSIKTYGLTSDGKEQITGFHLPGELLGLDAIGSKSHNCHAVALEDTEVCRLPYSELQDLAREMPRLQHELTCMLSREIQAENETLLMIGKMSAEQRLACFLHNLYLRSRQRGSALDTLRLPMSREDIGNYLGLTLETVSRRLGILQSQGIVSIDKRLIAILDMPALKSLCVT